MKTNLEPPAGFGHIVFRLWGRGKDNKTMKFGCLRELTVLVLLFGVFTGPAAFSQDDQADAAPEAGALEGAGVEAAELPFVTIEEIRVTAERTPFVLRRQLETATKDFVAGYNDLNDIDEFDINCGRSNWTGTNIQQWTCQPEFYERALADAAQWAQISGDYIFADGLSVVAAVRPKFEQLQNHIVRMALENPQLANHLLEMGKIQAALEAKKEACMAQPGFLGIFRLCR